MPLPRSAHSPFCVVGQELGNFWSGQHCACLLEYVTHLKVRVKMRTGFDPGTKPASDPLAFMPSRQVTKELETAKR